MRIGDNRYRSERGRTEWWNKNSREKGESAREVERECGGEKERRWLANSRLVVVALERVRGIQVRRWRSTITPSALCCGWFILYVPQDNHEAADDSGSRFYRPHPRSKVSLLVVYDDSASLVAVHIITWISKYLLSASRRDLQFANIFFHFLEIIFVRKLSMLLRSLNDYLDK